MSFPTCPTVTPFFGVFVKAGSLAMAAAAWSKAKTVHRALDMLAARRHKGTLSTTSTGGTSIVSLPDEILALIKRELNVECMLDAEDQAVWMFHGDHASLGGFTDYYDEDWSMPRLKLDDIHHCDFCNRDFFENGAMGSLVAQYRKEIGSLLKVYGLQAVSFELYAHDDAADVSEEAALALGVPLVSSSDSSNYPTIDCRPDGYSFDCNRVLSVSADLIQQCALLSYRFKRLFASFPVEPADFESNSAALATNGAATTGGSAAPLDTRSGFGRSAASRAIRRSTSPSWHIWASTPS
ncbi:hypothetical protein Rhopal_001011-T1 [Rhodotorula paludigena]|uniref:Uncharacterized protein n=1 Tax=Rhodotorula paludigena TaxID=86838 RepID=A0AAV5G6J1_9BASI|nr:hypothetical protein Rhopal_001011-T1 [Rhodotorula paludigena]